MTTALITATTAAMMTAMAKATVTTTTTTTTTTDVDNLNLWNERNPAHGVCTSCFELCEEKKHVPIHGFTLLYHNLTTGIAASN